VLPGLWLRAYAAGYVKKNRELTMTGPYAHTRNPLYLGSMLIAGGFALALLSWPVALVLAVGFLVIYVPVIASEERFLRATFPQFDAYSRHVPRLIPRLTPAPDSLISCTPPFSPAAKSPPAPSPFRSISSIASTIQVLGPLCFTLVFFCYARRYGFSMVSTSEEEYRSSGLSLEKNPPPAICARGSESTELHWMQSP